MIITISDGSIRDTNSACASSAAAAASWGSPSPLKVLRLFPRRICASNWVFPRTLLSVSAPTVLIFSNGNDSVRSSILIPARPQPIRRKCGEFLISVIVIEFYRAMFYGSFDLPAVMLVASSS
jgi:hypothetical protein